MAYEIRTMGSLAAMAGGSRYVAVVVLGNGTRPRPATKWRAEESFDAARGSVIFMARAANLAEPMWSGWVMLDGPNEIAPYDRALAGTAWRIF